MPIQAVLKYLRDCLNETEKVEPDYSDSNVNSVSKHTVPLQPIDNKFSLVASMLISSKAALRCYALTHMLVDPDRYTEQSHTESRPRPLDGALPLPLMQQATLHRQPEEKRKHKRPDTPSPVHSASRGKARQRRKRHTQAAKAKERLAAASRRCEQLSAEDKLEISTTIEKQKYAMRNDVLMPYYSVISNTVVHEACIVSPADVNRYSSWTKN